MKVKTIIFIIVGLVLIAGAGLYFGRVMKAKQSVISENSAISPTPTPYETSLHNDQSEFQFEYPKILNLNPHPEDNENYAHLELTHAATIGSIVLWTKDAKYQSIDDYIKGNKITDYLGSTLGELPAVKILDSQDKNKYSILTIRNGYLYQIDLDSKGESFWNPIFTLIIDSYKFTTSQQENKTVNTNSAPPSSEEIYSDEEVIE